MLRVGLTGGIGAGKSTVATWMAELGAVVIDADRLAREVVEPGTEGLARIVEHFGPQVLRDGRLDRPAVAAAVFADTGQRRALNAIVHPLVGRRSAEELERAPADAIVVHDVPLLVENSMGPVFHLVVVVLAEESMRVRRLVSHRNLAADDARARIRAQVDDAARRVAADVVLDNTGPPGLVEARVSALWRERLVPYEVNVRTGTFTAHPPVLVPADPTWAEQAGRLVARLSGVLGAAALRIDPIGSTAVPGLDARDCLDIQVTVRSLADADDHADELGTAGFPRHTFTQDTPKVEDPDPDLWRERLHVHADPGRAANVHIRVQGSSGQRFALIFRDWLRSEPDIVAEYRAVKRAAQVGHDTTLAYAEAKGPWFDTAYPRALEWARVSGWDPS